MAVDAQFGGIRKIGAELDEEGAEILVHAVKVVGVDQGRGVVDPGDRAALAKVFAHGPGHPRLLLGHPDKDHPFATFMLAEALLEDVILALAFLEAHQRDVPALQEIPNAGDKPVGHGGGVLG